MDQSTLTNTLRAAGFSLFDRDPYGARQCAQANLQGRTHYVEDGTLRFFHSRILSARAVHMGAAFLIVESCAANYDNTSRKTRFVLFDVDGHVIHRSEDCGTKDKALRAFGAWFEGFGLEAYYAEKMAADAARMKTKAADLAKHAKALARAVAKAN